MVVIVRQGAWDRCRFLWDHFVEEPVRLLWDRRMEDRREQQRSLGMDRRYQE